MRANLEQLSSTSTSGSPLSPDEDISQKGRKKRAGKGPANQLGDMQDGDVDIEGLVGMGEGTIEEREEVQRKVFLERNRLAASKSRLKKKERVGDLEHMASQIAAQNVQLQAVALNLRDQLLQLRHIAGLHTGCTCEHVIGYFKREHKGGGLPTIDIMAGRTFQMDYTNVPKLGSDDDLFAKMLPLPELPADIAEAQEATRKKNLRKAALIKKRKLKRAKENEGDDGELSDASLSPVQKW